MKQNISYKIVSIVFAVMTVCFLTAFYALAWNEPTAVPPNENILPPINIGTTTQFKNGGLGSNIFVWGSGSGQRGTLLPDGSNGGSIELGGKGTPYIDFTNDMLEDYDVRLVLTSNDVLTVDGGDLCLVGGPCLSGGTGGSGSNFQQNSRLSRFDIYPDPDSDYSAEWIDIPDSSITLTTPANGNVLIIYSGRFELLTDGGSTFNVRLIRDNTTEIRRVTGTTSDKDDYELISFQYIDQNLTAGNHTYKIQAYRPACNSGILSSCNCWDGPCLVADASHPAVISGLGL